MRNLPHFGRRGAQGAALTPKNGPYESAARRLQGVSERIRLAAELAAFVGLMIGFVACVYWPDHPTTLDELGARIFVPAFLAETLPIDSSRARLTSFDLTSTEIGITNGVVPLIALVGLIAILRGRWVFAVMITAFWLFPWSWFGYHLLPSPFVLCYYALCASFRVFRPSWRWCIVLVPLGVLAGPSVMRTIAPPFFAAAWDADRPRAEYRIVEVSDLVRSARGPEGERRANRKAPVSVSDFLGLQAGGTRAGERTRHGLMSSHRSMRCAAIQRGPLRRCRRLTDWGSGLSPSTRGELTPSATM
jgi:hypothetical protein